MESDEATLDASPIGAEATRFAPPAPPNGRVDIDLNVSDVFCYAMSHRPLIRGVAVTNRGISSGDELTLRFTVESPGSEVLLHEHEIAIPLPEIGDTAELRTIRLSPNPRALALLDEAVPANVVATASVDGLVVGVARRPVNILAYHQWMHRRDTYDSFAAFVLPNHPAIVPIMTRARELLRDRTGSSSTEGYQAMESDPDRIFDIAGAVYDSLQQQGYSYSNPPASFEGFGQKVRTPDVITAEMCCTCLDSTVLFASCLTDLLNGDLRLKEGGPRTFTSRAGANLPGAAGPRVTSIYPATRCPVSAATRSARRGGCGRAPSRRDAACSAGDGDTSAALGNRPPTSKSRSGVRQRRIRRAR